MSRTLNYFVSDVHLGLQVFDPADRERRFVKFLRSIPTERTRALYMLGDIWDFWYEWKYTVPKGYVQVLAALQDLMSAGVEVYFFQGNHDVWSYRYFEEMGMKRLVQPAFVTIGGKVFCLGHGDALGPSPRGYRLLRGLFHSRVAQILFSSLIHPTIAMAFGNAWSRNNRLARREAYVWNGESEPLVGYANKVLKQRHVDYFVFGHFHVKTTYPLAGVATLVMLDSWIYEDNWFCYDEAE